MPKGRIAKFPGFSDLGGVRFDPIGASCILSDMSGKRTVVVGFLGTVLDSGGGPKRWEKWRPSVALTQQDDLAVDRLELLVEPRFNAIAETVSRDVGSVSPDTAVVRRPFPVKNPWDFEEVYASLHDFARAYPWDTDREEYLFHITTGTHVAQICLFLLVESRHLPGRLLQTSPRTATRGGFEGSHQVIDLDLSKYDAMSKRFGEERRASVTSLKGGIETRNAAYNRLVERMERVAGSTKDPVLVIGPTGSGKTRLARRLYELKRAKRLVDGEFVEFNCATLRGDGAMSTLFGHVKGAYTGAVEARAGLLRKAHGGVLFLDEIGELGLDEQAMLLRAIEEKRFYPVGSDKEVQAEFQLLAGTNRPLRRAVAEGRFRDDLLARIDTWTFELPALKDRPEDVPPNVDHELERLGTERHRHLTLTREARVKYLAFAVSPEARWTGNFRDLAASVRRLATLSDDGRIGVSDVDDELDRLRASWTGGDPDEGQELVEAVLGPARARKLDRFDRVQLEEVVRVCRRARSLAEAGRVLFAVSRLEKTSVNDSHRLRKYLARFELGWDDVRGDEAREREAREREVRGA